MPAAATLNPAASKQIEPPSLDPEPDAGEDRDDRRRQDDRRVQHEAPFGQLVGAPEGRIREEQRRRGAQQRDEQRLADEPGVERVVVVVSRTCL